MDIISAPDSAEFTLAMQEFTGKSYESSEQHKEIGKARVKRNNEDFNKMAQKFSDFPAFGNEPALRNIVTGIEAEPDVNVNRISRSGCICS